MNINGMSLDATSTKEVGDLVSDNRTNSGVAQDYMRGADVGKGLLTQNDTYGSGLAYGNPMSQAIKQRAMSDYNSQYKDISNRALRAASEDHIRNLASATQMASEEVQMNRQKEMLKNQIDQANKRARGQVLGTVLGITGGIAGAYVGGPAGAAAGYSAGQGVGNMVGSS